MSAKHLGQNFDIHGGGTDLIFPHHENEIAQSRCAFPQSHFARYWVHNGMVNIDNEKMAKSANNFVTINSLLEKYDGEIIRLFFLRTHYRSELNFSYDALDETKKILDRFYRAALVGVDFYDPADNNFSTSSLENDLNTPLMISEMHSLATKSLQGSINDSIELIKAGKLLGLFKHYPSEWFTNLDWTDDIDRLFNERIAARKMRNYARADEIRTILFDKGIIIEDGSEGSFWRKK